MKRPAAGQRLAAPVMACGMLLGGVSDAPAFAMPMSLEQKCEAADEVVVFEVEAIAEVLPGVAWKDRVGAPVGLFGGKGLARCRVVEVIAGRNQAVGEFRHVPATPIWDPSYDISEGGRYVAFLKREHGASVPVHHSAVAKVDGDATNYRGDDGETLSLHELRQRVRTTLEAPPPGWIALRASCGLPYRLRHPGSEQAAEAGLPLVVFLHGAGERGDDNRAQLKHVALQFAPPAGPRPQGHIHIPAAVVLAPQCPAGHWWRGETLGRVIALAREWAARPEIDANRVYFAGLSMGAFGTWEALATAPDLIAAAVAVCGGGDPATAGRFRHIPVRVVHGEADQVVIPQRSREMVSALEAAGGTVEYIELPGVGHDSWTWAFGEGASAHWLLRQKRTLPADD